MKLQLRKKLAIVLILSLLTACNATMQNRIACSPDDSEMFMISKYGVWGITQDVDEQDAVIACNGIAFIKAMGGIKKQ